MDYKRTRAAMLYILIFFSVFFAPRILLAASSVQYLDSIQGNTNSFNNIYGYSSYYGYHPTFMSHMSIDLPLNIEIKSAKLYLYGYVRSYYQSDYYCYSTVSFLGQNFYGYPTWGVIVGGDNCPVIIEGWQEFDVKSNFADYNGGAQTFYFTSQIVCNEAEWHAGGIFIHNHNDILYKPYVIIDYEYIPSVPSITVPVAGKYYSETVELSAASTVTGGADIEYCWEYRWGEDDWLEIITTTQTTTVWTMPEDLPDEETVYVRCRSVANGVSSDYATVTFTKGVEPVVAAKYAAERVLLVLCRPTVIMNSPLNASATTNSLFPLQLIYTNRISDDLGEMKVTFKTNDENWAEWTDLPDTGLVTVEVPVVNGLNYVQAKVKNKEGVESDIAFYYVWRL